MTRKIIELTGRADVCSICGDDPASDYRLAEEHRPAGGADTLRLCDDCVSTVLGSNRHHKTEAVCV
jgi:hypothetical protein